MTMVNLDPNSFIKEIAASLAEKGVPLADQATTLEQIKYAAETAREEAGLKVTEETELDPNADYVLGLAGASDLWQLITFTGYVGATYTRTTESAAQQWTVLYLDTRLQSWLLIETSGIVYRKSVEDKLSPSSNRDVVWVKSEASVGQGTGSLSVEAQFLTGDFTRAGDYDVEWAGDGGLSVATGVFCEARSVGCCRGQSNRR
jgi:hypothetical protein